MQHELIKAEQYVEHGDLKQAEKIYHKYLSFDPDNPAVLHILGLISYHTGQLNTAVDLIQKAIRHDPQNPSFHRSLGDTYQDLNRVEDAISAYKHALKINPNCSKTLINMGNAFHKTQTYTHAMACFQKAIKIDPDCPKAYNNMGKTFQDQGSVENALAYYEKALALHQHYPEARFNRSTVLLLLGEYVKGFKDFEYRFVRSGSERIYPHQLDKPRWDGSIFFGKTLFVHSEQGLGDTIQFARYLPMLKPMGGTVIFETFKPLLNIFKSFPGVDELTEFSFKKKTDASFDCYIPLLSLPTVFKTDVNTIPDTVPYLFSTPEKKAYWGKKISKTGLNIGLVWSGKPTHGNDKNRSVDLIQFGSLFDMPGVNIYGLQKEKPSFIDKENLLFQNTGFTNLADGFIDFTDTAGAIENFDLTITVDTSVAHLAGAMGKPVWLLLPYVPDWRWLLDRNNSPWYPTMKIFRQKTVGNWEAVIEEVKQKLGIEIGKKLISEHSFYEKKPPPDTCKDFVYFFSQANTLYDSQRPNEAIYCYQIALKLNPSFAEACFNLAKAYHDLDQTDKAILYYKKTCEIHPAMFEPYYNLGIIYQKKQQMDQAVSCYEKAVAIKPDFFEAHNNLGSALQEQGHFHSAQLSYENALRIKPDYANALYNLGNLFQDTSNYNKAVSNYIKAISIKPDYSKAYGNMGRCHHLLGNFHAAEASFNKALSIDSDYVEAKFNLSITHLLTGNFAKGWQGYKWRLDKKLSSTLYPHSYSVPQWEGTSFEGKTLLVHSEQGLGDVLQFSRYLPWVKKRGGTVIFETRKSLMPLFKNFSGIDILLQQSDKKKPDMHFDYYVPLLSLPGLFNTDMDNLPANVPYIQADPRS